MGVVPRASRLRVAALTDALMAHGATSGITTNPSPSMIGASTTYSIVVVAGTFFHHDRALFHPASDAGRCTPLAAIAFGCFSYAASSCFLEHQGVALCLCKPVGGGDGR